MREHHPTTILEAQSPSGTVTEQFEIEVSVDPSLVGHWPMDQLAGTVAEDVSRKIDVCTGGADQIVSAFDTSGPLAPSCIAPF